MKKKLSFMLAVILILQIILPTIFVRADDNSKNKYQYNVLHNETEIKSNNQNYSKAYLEYLKLSDEEKSKLDVIPRKYDIPLDSIYEDTV